MAGKTNTEAIQDLIKLTTTLEEQVKTARKEIDLLREQRETINQVVAALKSDVIRVDSQVADARKDLADRMTRAWSVGLAIWSAVLAAALTFFVQRILLGK